MNEPHATEGRRFEKALLHHRWLHKMIGWIGETGLTCMIWPRFVAPFQWRLRRHAMPLPTLAAEFEGYKILFISDLHLGKADLKYLHRAIRGGIAETQPDVILIGGDLIHYNPASLHPLRETLPLFGAPDGVYAVFGNHDYREYSWRHNGKRSAKRSIHRRLVAALADSPVRLLRNEAAILRRGDARVQIVGMDEMWADLLDADKAFGQVAADQPTICLQHNPDGVELLKGRPWDWLLAGHSHGGQVVLPVAGALYVPMAHRHYLRGFFEFAAAGRRQTMYVSTGIGYTQPLRMRVPPEMVLFTLTRGDPRGPEGMAVEMG